MAHSDSVFESPADISHLYVIHLIVSRYYSFIVYLPKISAFAYFIPKGTERDQTRFSAYFSLCCACKIKKYKTPTQKLFGTHWNTHSHPVNSLTFIRVLFLILFPFAVNIFMFKNSSESWTSSAHLYSSFPKFSEFAWRSSRYPLPVFIHLSFKVNVSLFYCLVFL